MVQAYVDRGLERMVPNNGGGLGFEISPMERLERFLILGSDEPTFYQEARELTRENLINIQNIIVASPREAVAKIVEIGTTNRAPKHDPVLVAYAMAVADVRSRAYALPYFNDVIRTGTHLFSFFNYYKGRGGWGRSVCRAFANWYTEKPDTVLALQITKYKQRYGVSHSDVLNMAHAVTNSPSKNALLHYATYGNLEADDSDAHEFVAAVEEIAHVDTLDKAIQLVVDYNLPREVVPTRFMNTKEMWAALVPTMGMTALIRNLRNMQKDGYLVQGEDAVRIVRERLLDENDIRRSRIHPALLFLASKQATLVPEPIKRALDEAFLLSFGNVPTTNKRIMLAIDTSTSMNDGAFGHVATPREWAAVMALVTAHAEPYAEFRAFTHRLVPMNIHGGMSLRDVMAEMRRNHHNGRTNCAAPMQAAADLDELFDAFVVYTDNETNTTIHGESPRDALYRYRGESGIHNAKLAVVAATSTGFSIADPRDANMLDFVGFDANAPAIMSNFIAK